MAITIQVQRRRRVQAAIRHSQPGLSHLRHLKRSVFQHFQRPQIGLDLEQLEHCADYDQPPTFGKVLRRPPGRKTPKPWFCPKPEAGETRKPAPKKSGFRRFWRLPPPASAIKATEPPRAVNEPVRDGVAPAASPKTAGDEYLIGAGDVVQVSVWGEQSASVPSAVVRPDGKISVPLLKEVAIAGLTPTQAEKTITEQLDQYIKGANVTVVVSQINSKKIYLLGAVKKEGTISYTYRMTVMQALSEAGGLTDYAKRRKIYVIRSEDKKKDRLPFDYNAVVKGERMELNITLEPGDTIVVPH